MNEQPKEEKLRSFTKILLVILIGMAALFHSAVVRGVENEAGQWNCFAFLVGKDASEDGSVILAHNEDDGGKFLVDCHMVPPLDHEPGEMILLKNGGQIPQVEKTLGFLWLQIPGLDFADNYLNEYGVTVSSNSCRSREKGGRLVNGGIGYYLRRIMVERAKTAREAVKVAGRIIEKNGYLHSGRTYLVADPNEAWVLAVVKGTHWIAQRVPDDHVAIIPNCYTIENVDLADQYHFMGSPDLVKYAVQKGWYDPKKERNFIFRDAYGKPSSQRADSNVARHWRAMNLLAGKRYDLKDRLPFSFKPKRKLTIPEIKKVLADHYEGTQFQSVPPAKNPHYSAPFRICSESNQCSTVAQLRSWLPVEMGAILWVAPRRPCVNAFVPWYCGILRIPHGYSSCNFQEAIENHFSSRVDVYDRTSSHAFWRFAHLAERLDGNYDRNIDKVMRKKAALEKEIYERQDHFEKRVLSVYKENPEEAREMLTGFTAEWAERALRITE
jgi:dipeptidase